MSSMRSIRTLLIGVFILCVPVYLFLYGTTQFCQARGSHAKKRLKPAEYAPRIPDERVQHADCQRIFNGDEEEIKKAFKYSNAHKKDVTNDSSYIEMTKNCSDFVRTRQYITVPVNEEEENFPIAYAVMVYKDLMQVERLLRMIYRPQNLYCFHIDVKAKPEFRKATSELLSCFDNVFLIPDRVDVAWGFFSVLEPVLTCMKHLLSFKNWRYFINLTGQEVPLKTNWELVQILTAYKGGNDIEGPILGGPINGRVRFKVGTKEKKEPPPHNIKPAKGSIYIAASRAYVDFLLNDDKVRDFTNWLKDTAHPDETLFSTINNNNPHLRAPGSYTGDEKKPFLMRSVIWQGQGMKCHGKFVRSVCIMGIKNLIHLTTDKQLFVNKFYQTYQWLGLDCLESWYFDKVRLEYHNQTRSMNITYYEQLPWADNHV